VAAEFDVTEDTVAVKLALEAPAATVTEGGTVTAELLLATLTANPPLGAVAFSVTVQSSVPDPVNEPFAQLRPFSTGTPAPLRLMTFVVPVDESLVNVSVPGSVPATLGSNLTINVADWPLFSVSGKLAPETL
jgi:hypothetical protein